MNSRTIIRLGLLLLAVGLLWPQAGGSQERGTVWTYQTTARGWVGVTVSFDLIVENGVETRLVRISEVTEGGPAERAGVQVGDVITHIDGRPVTQRYFAALPNTLSPGDLVEMVVTRNGEPVEISVEAAERETHFTLHEPDIERMVIMLDTIRGAIHKNLESLTVTITDLQREQSQGAGAVELLRLPPRGDELPEAAMFRFQAAADSLSGNWNAYVVDPGISMSFRGFLVGSAESDSLNQELLASRKELNELRRREESRVRQIRASIQGDPQQYLEADEILQGLRMREAELVASQEELAQRLTQVQEAQVRTEWAEVRARTNEAYAEAQLERALAAERWADQDAERNRWAEEVWRQSLQDYRSPIFVGQDVVWGAELKPLTEAQAEVLAADGGILVVQVPEGTPAAEVGLQDLDVIVSVAGERIQSLGDLRLSLELFEGPLVLRVIRKGEPVEVRIRR